MPLAHLRTHHSLSWLILCFVGLCQFGLLRELSSADYRLILSQWWDQSSEGKLVDKGGSHQGVPLLRGQTAALPVGSRMELTAIGGEVFRLGGSTHFTLLHDRQFRLSAGSMVLYLPASAEPVRIQGPATELWLRGEGTLAIQVTANQGMKIICLSHQPKLELQGQGTELAVGRVYFLPPNSLRLGPSLLINLDLFLRTSLLIQGFENSLPSNRVMLNNAFRQSIAIQNRSNLFVGDATSAREFDLLILE